MDRSRTTSNTTSSINLVEKANELIYDINAKLDIQLCYRYVKGKPFIIYMQGNIDQPLITVKNYGEMLKALEGIYTGIILIDTE